MAELSWCRDIDYGSLPQYIAIAVAAVAAFFSVRGYALSQKSFREDVRNREYAQARLVYADILMDDTVGPKNTMDLPVAEMPGYVLDWDIKNPPGSTKGTAEHVWTPAFLRVAPEGNHWLRVIKLVVHNNSEELISDVDLNFDYNYETDSDPVNVVVWTLAPRSKAYVVIVSDNDESRRTTVKMTFRDSTGIYWRRVDARPVIKQEDWDKVPKKHWWSRK